MRGERLLQVAYCLCNSTVSVRMLLQVAYCLCKSRNTASFSARVGQVLKASSNTGAEEARAGRQHTFLASALLLQACVRRASMRRAVQQSSHPPHSAHAREASEARPQVC